MLGIATSLALAATCGYPALATDPPRLTTGPSWYAITGTQIEVFRDNLVMSWQDDGAPYDIAIGGVSGTMGASSWAYTPSVSGSTTLTVSASYGGAVMEAGSPVLRVSNGAIASTKVVIVGDSLTDNVTYPPALKALTDPAVTYLGTQTDGGVANEGHSGQTWCWFATNASSPFRDGGAVDIANYLSDVGDTPDVVVWMLGVNGVFTSGLSGVDAAVAAELACADTLIAAWVAEAPSTVHGVVLVTPGNKLDAPYFSTFSPPTNAEWTWRQKNHREVELMIAHWTGDGGGGVYLIPANLGIDRLDGYPAGDPFHPDASGCAQIAAGVHAWLAWVR